MLSRLLLPVLLAVSSLLMALPVRAEILIAPTRVTLDPGERSTELVVVNKGNEETAFRISVENRRMLLDGAMEAVETAQEGELFAREMVRFSPRRIILKPGERQIVRVSARFQAGMEPGEYRSHLRLQGAPLSAGRTLQSATNEDGEDLSIQLIAIRSITIPVILRVGELDADVDIQALELRPSSVEDETLLVARLNRTGSRSTYGDVKVYTPDQPEPVFFARGIAIYTPNTERDLVLPLPDAVRDRLKGQQVRIEYISSNPDAPGVIADFTTRLP